MSIEIVDDRELWDKSIEYSIDGLLFHKWDYLRITAEHTGYKLYTFGIYKKDELIALIPIFYRNIGGFKTLFSPPPKTAIPHLGPVVSSNYYRSSQSKREEYLRMLEEGLTEIRKLFSPSYTSIICVPGLIDIRYFKWNGFLIEPLYTYEVDLNRPLQEISNGIQPRTRKYIKAHMDKISLRSVESREDINTFYDLEAKCYSEQRLAPPLVSKEYIYDLIGAFRENIRIFLIEGDSKELLGIWGTVIYKDRYITWIGGTKPVGNGFNHVNECAYWLTMKGAKEDGFATYELMGANTKRLCNFKSKFNPRLVCYFRVFRKDMIGAIGEIIYKNFMKKGL